MTISSLAKRIYFWFSGSGAPLVLLGQIDDTQAVSQQPVRAVSTIAQRTVTAATLVRTVSALSRRRVLSAQPVRLVGELP